MWLFLEDYHLSVDFDFFDHFVLKKYFVSFFLSVYDAFIYHLYNGEGEKGKNTPFSFSQMQTHKVAT